jgi:hypothetical protein
VRRKKSVMGGDGKRMGRTNGFDNSRLDGRDFRISDVEPIPAGADESGAVCDREAPSVSPLDKEKEEREEREENVLVPAAQVPVVVRHAEEVVDVPSARWCRGGSVAGALVHQRWGDELSEVEVGERVLNLSLDLLERKR